MTELKFYFYIGGLGSEVNLYAKKFADKHPDYVFADFIGTMISQDSYVNKSEIISYPSYLNSQPYSTAKLAIDQLINDGILQRKNVIVYGAGINVETNLIYIKLYKQLGYKIILRYVDTPLQKQIKNVKNLNKTSLTLFTPIGQVIDNNKLLELNLPKYKLVADKFQVFTP